MIGEIPIDYVQIGTAIRHYTDSGFQRVDPPWHVPTFAINSTLPVGCRPHRTFDGCLIGSAEQGLAWLGYQDKIGPGSYVACTPCFRDDVPDETHVRCFVKVELMYLSPSACDDDVDRLMTLAEQAFWALSRRPVATERVKTGTGWDIEMNGLEIGSYGIREWEGLRWAYGTGLAEPRFTMAEEVSR